MPSNQVFGVMEEIEEKKSYIDYEPEKYDCIFIDDDFFTEIYMRNLDMFKEMETFINSIDRHYQGLSLCGITLIPPKSLKTFLDIIVEENTNCKSKELKMLIEKISIAIKENKYIIHYGD